MKTPSPQMLCHCQDIEANFDKNAALKELKKYHKKGPGKTTRILLDYITNKSIKGLTLLDIGGGVGIMQHELRKYGIGETTHVDASSAYLEVSEEEAKRLGHKDHSSYFFGDFVDLASTIPQADIVTLVDVICCYPDLESLVENSATSARKTYGLVYPKATWWTRMLCSIINIYHRMKSRTFRYYIHSKEDIHSILQSSGFERCFNESTWLDLVEVFERKDTGKELAK